MTQPPAYTRSFSFTDFSSSYPTTPPPGTAIDAELGAVALTLAAVLANLVRIQRDDGALKNQIVTLDSLNPAVLVALGAGVTWLPRGAWVTGTAYAVSDVIQSGTATYVCAVAHTAAAELATDVATGKWVLLYDSAGSVPADGTVSAAKLAAGAVTTAAIGFTSLDLTGNIRAQTGIQAGSAPAGALMHARTATGAAHLKIERVLDTQGAVGLKIIGVGATWEFSQAVSGTALDIAVGALPVGRFTTLAGLDIGGALRATAGVVPASAAGFGLHYAASVGYLTAYNYTTNAWLDCKLRGLAVSLTASGVDVLTATSAGIDITGTAKRGGVELGWLDIPQNAQNGAYTIAAADRGKHIYSANVAGQTIILPTGLPADMAVVIVNDGTNPITLSTTGTVVRLAGSALTGDRTIAANGMATILRVAANRFFISGSGIS